MADERQRELNEQNAAPNSPDETSPPLTWDAPPAASPLTPPSSHLPPPSPTYPVRYDVAYSDHLSRWKTLLRLPFLLPVWLFLYLVQFALFPLVAVGWTTVFWRRKHPSWAFQGAAGAMAFSARATAFGLLQTDRFPSFDIESSPVTLEFDPPPSGQLSRWRVFFWKLTLLVPQLVVLWFLQLALFAVTVIAWFAILITGHYPRGLFPFATGVMRWHYRVAGYFFSFNDRYPPYALSASAGPAGAGATVASGISGFLLGGGFTALIVVAGILGSRPHRETADYAALQRGQSIVETRVSTSNGHVLVALERIYDPGDSMAKLLRIDEYERIVVVEWRVAVDSPSASVSRDAAYLTARSYGWEHDYDAQIVTVDNRAAPATLGYYDIALIRAVFVIPIDATPLKLRFHHGFAGRGGIEYELR